MDESLPYGLRDVKIAPLLLTGAPGTIVDLPNAQTLSFEEAEDFDTLRGDDKDVASRGKGASVSWELESGGISLEALVVLGGGTLVVSGVTPATIKKYTKSAGDQRPEFYAEGQAMSESGGDFHTVLYRCKATDSFKGEMADGSFWLSNAKGTAYPSKDTAKDGALYDFVQNETATAIAQS